jgi:ADP-heptose:LPS heptosyltransferase
VKRRVLIVRPDALGDVVLAGPAVRAVAASGADVTMLCSPTGAPAAQRLPGVTRTVVARLPWIELDAPPTDGSTLNDVVDRVRAVHADEAVILTSSHQSSLPTALLVRLAGIERVGGISVDYPGSLLDVALRGDDDVHEVERGLRLVAAMGYELPDSDPRTLELRRRRAGRRLRGSSPFVVVHPGASAPARTLSLLQWQRVVAYLCGEGMRVFVTGGPAELRLTAQVAAAHPFARDCGGRFDLDEFLDVLDGAAAVVVGNTGPAHLAAAVGSPVVSVFPPTVPAARWHPWGVRHVILGDQTIPCAGCRARTCPQARPYCVSDLRPSDVLDAVRLLVPALGAGSAA